MEEVKKVLRSFGLDEFMASQIATRLAQKDLINKEPLGDAISKVLSVLDNEGWELPQIHSAVEAMMDAGVVFRER